MKPCFKCKNIKPISEFYKHSAMKYGYLNKCKECCIKNTSKHYKENIKNPLFVLVKREKARINKKPLLNKRNRIKDEWINKNPEKRNAHIAVNNALRDGRITKYCCEECFNDNVQAHHKDYSKPLEVTWLCIKCHNKFHVRERELKLLF